MTGVNPYSPMKTLTANELNSPVKTVEWLDGCRKKTQGYFL